LEDPGTGSYGKFQGYLPWAPKTMKNKGFGHLKTRLYTIKTSKNIGFGAHGIKPTITECHWCRLLQVSISGHDADAE